MAKTGASLRNNLYFEVKVDGEPLVDNDDEGLPNAIKQVEVIENIALLTPMLRMVFNDTSNFLRGRSNISEDNRIDVVMARDESHQLQSLSFRMFNTSGGVAGEGHGYVIRGLLDAPAFTKGIENKAYKDTSTNVIKQVLGSCGITATVAGSTDLQVWINPGLTRNRFVQQVLDHSFSSVQALLKLGITADKKARIVDVMQALQSRPVAKIAHGNKDALECDFETLDIQQADSGGLLGSWVGYGHDLYDPRIDGSLFKSDGIRVNSGGSFLPVNTETYGAIASARKDYAPQDGGNTHERYWQAFHANQRKAALFSQGLTLIVRDTTGINVLDCVEVKTAEMKMMGSAQSDPMNQTRGGKYLVVAKKRIIKGTQYAEMFLLKRIAVNNQGKASLLNQDGRGSPTPTEVDQGQGGVSEWTYASERRFADPKDNCHDIVDEECMPTGTDSTEWDEPEDWTDTNEARSGPYERALTQKIGEVKHREKDTDPPARP